MFLLSIINVLGTLAILTSTAFALPWNTSRSDAALVEAALLTIFRNAMETRSTPQKMIASWIALWNGVLAGPQVHRFVLHKSNKGLW